MSDPALGRHSGSFKEPLKGGPRKGRVGTNMTLAHPGFARFAGLDGCIVRGLVVQLSSSWSGNYLHHHYVLKKKQCSASCFSIPCPLMFI